ncbi:hypothetical protein PsalN5692_03414 [Piscirickettsia salmonis]|uniref:PilN domain-containing protein n=2 Tax=Piscirickettsia salmonis TaxID=1238 RepID=UPI0020637027|nr:hypothetical protein PsalN5692_03414 [Piscirickettsia salmonis]
MRNINFLEKENFFKKYRLINSVKTSLLLCVFLVSTSLCLTMTLKTRPNKVERQDSDHQYQEVLANIQLKLQEVQLKLNQLHKINNQKYRTLYTLYKIYQITPRGIYFKSMSYHDGVIDLQGVSRQKALIRKLINDIESSADLAIDSVNISDDVSRVTISEKIRFSLVAHFL